jgi:tRNA-2-methylthio-N6-dimethylallyladenosine synthase
MTSHPKDLTKEVIDTVAECEKLCNHIHLPVQAGSDRILKEMNRGYTSAQYLSLIQYAKSKITDLVLSSDIIVGFPSETEEDFNDTLALIKEVRFDTLFTFIYSKRKGTPADTMKEQIPYPEKHRRFSLLIKEQNLISKMINDDYVGKTVRVLCEGKAEGDDGLLCGRTDGNKIVNFTGSEINIGKFVFVKITKSRTWSLYGEIK